MKAFKNLNVHFTRLVILNLITLILMFLMRFTFFILFSSSTDSIIATDSLIAFYIGLKFDIVIITYASFIYLVYHLVESIIQKYIITFKSNAIIPYFIFTSVIFFLNACDFGFYSYFNEHFNSLIFGFFEDDTTALLITIHKNYNLFLIFSGIILFNIILFKVYKFSLQLNYPDQLINSKKTSYIFLFLLLPFLYFGHRGSFNRLAISTEDTQFSDNKFYNDLSLPGIISLNKTIRLRNKYAGKKFDILKQYKFKTIKEAYSQKFEDIKPDLIETLKHSNSMKSNGIKNVILIIMESFGSHIIPFHSNSFNILAGLEKHISEDYFYTNMLPADNGTIGSVLGIQTSLVPIKNMRYISEGPFSSITLKSSVNLAFKNDGFETSYIYGGKLGWRNLAKYMSIQGYKNVIGGETIKKRYPQIKDIGNEWGVYDEYIFKYLKENINFGKKNFITILTTTNHPPYEVPKDFKSLSLKQPSNIKQIYFREKELVENRFKTLQYSNYQVSQFIDSIKNSALKDNTIIAFTGDHSFWTGRVFDEEDVLNKFSVPFYLYIPSKLRTEFAYNKDINLSHIDISPTLSELATHSDYYTLGESIFDKKQNLSLNAKDILIYKSRILNRNKVSFLSEKYKDEMKLDFGLMEKLYYSHQVITYHFLKAHTKEPLK